MKRKPKTATSLIAAALTVLFAVLSLHERAVASHQTGGNARLLMFLFLGLTLIFLFVLYLACAGSVKTSISSVFERWMVQSGASADSAPEIDEAQNLRKAGQPLEAIQVLRDYLKANPYQLQVMSRIAEIYRYDLGNDLAAALEYEELLKHKLPDEQWAWAALHLAKLYGRLNELEKSVDLLEKLDNSYSHTVAGRRAKRALEQVRNPESDRLSGDDSEEEFPTS